MCNLWGRRRYVGDDDDDDNNNNNKIINKIYLTGEITLHVAQTVNREELQHCVL